MDMSTNTTIRRSYRPSNSIEYRLLLFQNQIEYEHMQGRSKDMCATHLIMDYIYILHLISVDVLL